MAGKQDSVVAPSVNEILEALARMEQYTTIATEYIYVQLRRSIVPRRPTLSNCVDFDIVQIQTTPEKSGIGTKFVINLIEAARIQGRGVFLEQTITDASRAWAATLVEKGLMQPFQPEYGPFNYISVPQPSVRAPIDVDPKEED